MSIRATQSMIRKSMRVIPSYSCLFGSHESLEKLIEIVREYSVREWFSFLSRISCMLAGPETLNIEMHKRLARGLMGPQVLSALQAFEAQNPKTHILTACNYQVTAMQQIAAIYAPASGDRTFEGDIARDDLWTALLLVWDLLHLNRPTKSFDETQRLFLRDIVRGPAEHVLVPATRAFYLYQLGRSGRSRAARKLMQMFNTATGVCPPVLCRGAGRGGPCDRPDR